MQGRWNRLLVFVAGMICLLAVESRAQDVAVVAMLGSSEVDFIDIDTATVLKRVKLIGRASLPQKVAVTPDGATAIVTCETGYICFVDVASMTATKTLRLLKGPERIGRTLVPNEFEGVEVTPDGTTALVTEGNEGGALLFVDIATQEIIGSPLMLLGDGPGELAITPDGVNAFVVDDGLATGAHVFR